MSEHTRKTGTVASALLLAVLIAVGLLVGSGDKSDADDGREESATTTTMPSAAEDERDCPETWKIVHIDHEDSNRWFADGVQEIRDADTPEEAREAARTWLSLVRRDPQLLKGAASYFTDNQVNASDLVDGECASEAAESLTAEIELAIAEATVTPDEAPADGTNSGTDADGNVTSAAQAGITGDRDAIKVVLKDGTTVWIMARCGNPVVQGPAPVPPGPTDQPPAPPGTVPPGTVPPPTTTTTKPPTSYDCQQNGTGPNCPFPDVQQPPQDNDTSGVNTGPTPGAPAEPYTPPPGPAPVDNSPAPPPTEGGYDSGSPDGSNTPGGSTCDSSGCTGGGSTPPAEGPPPTVDDGTYGGDPGGF